MNKEKEYKIPRPIISKNENALQQVNNRYKKLTTPGFIAKTGKKVEKVVPSKVKKMASDAKEEYNRSGVVFSVCMKIVADGFDVLEKQAAKTAISEKSIVKSK